MPQQLNEQMFNHFEYVPKSTKADSPIDLALLTHAGVCQDFAHIMTTLVRSKLRIPCRYVSGYLHHGRSDHDRSVNSATHAWVEALVPQLGWVGFDPTNWLVAGDRHIRTAIGRDYADVPPTHGIFRGRANSELTVAVRVTPSEGAPSFDEEMRRCPRTGRSWWRKQRPCQSRRRCPRVRSRWPSNSSELECLPCPYRQHSAMSGCPDVQSFAPSLSGVAGTVL